MTHNFITVVIPVRVERRQEIEGHLNQLQNPANTKVRNYFRETQIIHFISSALIYGDSHSDYLVFEISADNAISEVLAIFDNAPMGLFDELFEAIGQKGQKSSVLKANIVKSGVSYFNLPGLNFSGTPGMTVGRIKQDSILARGIRDYFDKAKPSGSSLEIVSQLRHAIKNDLHFTEAKEGALPLSDLILDKGLLSSEKEKLSPTHPKVVFQIVIQTIMKLMWPFLFLAAIATYFSTPSFNDIYSFLWGVSWRMTLWSAGLLIGGIVFFIFLLLRREKNEGSDLSFPESERLAEVRAREDYSYVQNHLFGVSEMKPGILRKIAIRFTFLVISVLAKTSFKSGYLSEIGTIHFARWFTVPNTNKLIFCSNYGGSWESYLEDFITKASEGLTGVWSNTFGFPQSKLLFFKGAVSGEAFKRWARRQQIPTRFWYCAYPHLTTERIRLNAAIHRGLLTVSSETEADRFLSLFASKMRPKSDIERDEIQTLMFKGLGKHKQSACLLLQLPKNSSDAKDWLKSRLQEIGFGGVTPLKRIDQIALSASGLSKLGLNKETLSQFSYPFLQGMAHEERSRILADTGEDAPARWRWGQKTRRDDRSIDCAYMVYMPKASKTNGGARTLLETYCTDIESSIEKVGGRLVDKIITTSLDDRKETSKRKSGALITNADLPREPFGFVDGISQPIIKGLERGKTQLESSLHHVEAGEFILGYPDNRGTQTLLPVLDAIQDPNNILPDYDLDLEETGSVSSQSVKTNSRAFARNGSYLVIRQLDQDVASFNEFIEKAAKEHKGHKGIPNGFSHEQIKAFLAAKIVGRWKDGTSLVKFPYEPGTGWDGKKSYQMPDNDFYLGKEDPTGHSCPYGSHIRRSNPRDSFEPHGEGQLSIVNRHRILRRGRFYTNPDTEKKGLLFICLNADIERQFEFIQQTWCQARQFMGLDNEVDPILGRGGKMGRITIPTEQGPLFLKGSPDAVSVVGGEYFFMPSRSALKYLSE